MRTVPTIAALTIATLSASLIHTQLAAAAPAAQPYEPTSRWNVDYANDSCALRRGFGPADRQVLLELRQYAPSDTFQMTIASPLIKDNWRMVKVRFRSNEKLREQTAYSLTYPNGFGARMWPDSFLGEINDKLGTPSNAERDAREKSVSGIEIAGVVSPSIRLETGSMNAPMSAMRTCTDELLTHWGIEPKVHRTLTRRVAPKGQALWAKVIQDTYPSAMLDQMKSGIVNVRMIVGTDGKPISCHIQIPSQDPTFETTACSGMMKASRFEPALDATGKPVKSYFVTRIVYVVD